ncbi:hemicentin-1-like [Carcharodon carcharias]|uniref:hemicentin-1-like n=1 Tax=Carcharodon carcharias TaxID=13397 RepID=UPI001B7EBB34|nr:hemicentin-1-like [Carcharodon carcharias]
MLTKQLIGSTINTVATGADAPQNLSITSLDMFNASSINIIERNSAVIICSVESFPASNLTWRHLNAPMHRTSSNNELLLVIPHVISRDTGDYQCVAENEHGAVEGFITITVEYAPRNLSINSLDMINTSSINIIEGNSAVIICSVESFPASNLTWRHLNVPVNRTSSINELWLVIPHVTSRDTGDYQCVADNEHGAVEGFITITVEYAPRNLSITSFDMINASSINIIEGNSAVIICSVKTFPAANLTWRHLNVPINRTSSNNELWLVIPHITSRDTGDYQCVAENEHGAVEGFITITVEYAPQNLSVNSLDMINTSSINIIEGNSAVIICSVESFPASNLTWQHLNVPMNRTSSNNELWLVIPRVTSRDTGDYQCVAENEHGAVEGFITITVECRDSSKWTVGLLTAGIMLCVFLAGIFICVRKRKTATEERVSGTSDIALTPRSHSVKHQGKQNVLITEPRDTTRDTTSEEESPAPRDLPEGPVGGDAGHGNPDKPDELLCANINFSKLPSGDQTVHRSEDTEYAQIRFQEN